MALIEIAGFTIPFEWLIGIVAGFSVLGMMVLYLTLFRKKESASPFEENLVLQQPIDEHDNLQPGQLIGGAVRTETDLVYQNPDWIDDDGNKYLAMVPIERKVPFVFFDIHKALKRLWIVMDKGHLEAASASVLVKGMPFRWDPPFADRRKAGRYLVGGWGVRGGTGQLLQTKTGILFITGLILSGMLLGLVVGHIARF